MKKMKRYNEGGDSNAGMAEAYDEGAPERANSSEDSQAIMNEAKGDTMLKAMRDEAAKPKKSASKAQGSKGSLGANLTYGKGLGRRSHPEYPEDASKAMADKKSDFKNNPPSALSRAFSAIRERGMKSNPSAYKSGGMTASSRADGIATKGKTKGTIIMCGGGYSKGKK